MKKIIIDSLTNSADLECFSELETIKTQIIVSNSLRANDNHITHIKNRYNKNYKRWPHYTVNRNGIIYQHINSDYKSEYHDILKSERTISIVLSNMGGLIRVGDNNYCNAFYETCDGNILNYKYNKTMYWEGYEKKQSTSLLMLINFLCKKHGINFDVVDFMTYHKDICNYRGIVYDSNYFNDLTLINPFLNKELFRIKE